MLRINIAVEELIEGAFKATHSCQKAVLTKEDALKTLKSEYLRAKKFLEENWHNGN